MKFKCPECGSITEQENRYPAPRCYECIAPEHYTSPNYTVTGKNLGATAKVMEVQDEDTKTNT